MAAYQQHYNEHRPHRARNQLPPGAGQQPIAVHDSCAPASSAASSSRGKCTDGHASPAFSEDAPAFRPGRNRTPAEQGRDSRIAVR
ncbi:hypothetical protein ABZ468_52600, partial [Streptomyces sp. NPDC005708]